MSTYWESAAEKEFRRIFGGGIMTGGLADAYDLFRAENSEYLKAFQTGLDMGLSEGEARANAIKITERHRR